MSNSHPRERHVEVAGRSFHLREWGDPSGEPLLLLHGVPANGLLWRDVAPALAAGARVLALDLLGYGRSDPPCGRPVDIQSQAGYVVEVMDALQLRSATVVGHDIGGGVAQLLAVRHTDRVARLGLVNTVCYDSWPIPEMRALQFTAPLVAKLPSGLATRGLKLGLRRGFVHQDRAETFLDLFLEPFSTQDGLDNFIEHVRSLDSRQTEEVAPLLPHLEIPVAVVWGRQDPFLGSRLAEQLTADMPTAELTLIEEASHFAPADAPVAVAEAIRQLLQRPYSRPRVAGPE